MLYDLGKSFASSEVLPGIQIPRGMAPLLLLRKTISTLTTTINFPADSTLEGNSNMNLQQVDVPIIEVEITKQLPIRELH